MRRNLPAVLMMTLCLLLTSCGAGENGIRDALTFRQVLQEHGGCSFTAEVTTEIEDRGYSFTLSAEYQSGGPTTLTVTAPETIAGISAAMTDRDTVLSFDGVELDFGCLDDAMTTPLYAPLVFGQCWDTAYIDCGGMDGENYRVTYRLGYEDEELILETWFSGSVPVRCELYREESLLLSASVENFTFLT